MKDLVKALVKINYWAIVLLPFSVAIAPGFANSVIGIMIVTFLAEKLIKREKISISLPVVLFAGFMLVGALSFINTVSPKDSLRGMTKLLKFFLIFVVCSQNIRGKEHFKMIAISVASAISLIGIDAFWQLYTGRDFIRGNTLNGNIGLTRATASFPGCNAMGVYLTGLTPLIAGLALFALKTRERLFFTLAALLGSAGVYLSLSRSAGIGLFVSIFFLSLLRKNKIMVTGLVLLVAIFPFIMPKNIKDWAKSVNYNPVILIACETRWSLYRNTLHMIAEHPFIGVGVNTFSKNYGLYKTAEAEAQTKTQDTSYAHNSFLQMAGEMGLLGLGVFLAFIFFTLKSVWLSYKRNPDPFLRAFSISVFAAIIAYLINGITETNLYYARIVMIFWFLIGAGLALAKEK